MDFESQTYLSLWFEGRNARLDFICFVEPFDSVWTRKASSKRASALVTFLGLTREVEDQSLAKMADFWSKFNLSLETFMES